MLIVETIAKVRRLFRHEHKSIREISRELRLSRKVVRKALRSDATAFAYKRQRQPRPQLPQAPAPPPPPPRRPGPPPGGAAGRGARQAKARASQLLAPVRGPAR